MKRTYQASKVRRARTHGFLVRMKSRGGRAVINARRAKGRKRLRSERRVAAIACPAVGRGRAAGPPRRVGRLRARPRRAQPRRARLISPCTICAAAVAARGRP